MHCGILGLVEKRIKIFSPGAFAALGIKISKSHPLPKVGPHWWKQAEKHVVLHMPNFIQTIFQSMSSAQQRVLLYWPNGGRIENWQADVLLALARGFGEQIAQGLHPQGKVYMPLQKLSATRLMALLALMAQGGAMLLPPPKLWFKLLWQWRKQPEFGGVLLIDEASPLLRLLLWCLRIRCYRLYSLQQAGEPIAAELPDDVVALVSYSSGSTGQPKVLKRTHALLEAQHSCLKACFPPFDGQIDSSLFPNVLLHQLATATASRLPFSPGTPLARLPFDDIVQSWRGGDANTLTGNPWFFRQMLARSGELYPHIRACGVGGAPVDEDLLAELAVRFPHAAIYVIYGATEAEPIALRRYQAAADKRLGYAVGEVVDCLSGFEIRQPQPVRAGAAWVQAGEIFVRGAHVLSAQGEWHGTGDFGYLQNGQLYLTARQGNTVPCAGYQHFMIEHVLRSQMGISQIAVLTKTHGIKVFYSGAASQEAVLGLIKAHFPEIQQIDIQRQKALPLDARHQSKLMYHILQYGNRVPIPAV